MMRSVIQDLQPFLMSSMVYILFFLFIYLFIYSRTSMARTSLGL